MLSEDVEVFDPFPIVSNGQPLFAQVLPRAVRGPCLSDLGFRQPRVSLYGDTVGIVNAYSMFTGGNQRLQVPVHPPADDLGLPHQSGQWKIVPARPLLCLCPSLRESARSSPSLRWNMTIITAAIRPTPPYHELKALCCGAPLGDRQALTEKIWSNRPIKRGFTNIAVRCSHPQDPETHSIDPHQVLPVSHPVEPAAAFRTCSEPHRSQPCAQYESRALQHASWSLPFKRGADNTPELRLAIQKAHRRTRTLLGPRGNDLL